VAVQVRAAIARQTPSLRPGPLEGPVNPHAPTLPPSPSRARFHPMRAHLAAAAALLLLTACTDPAAPPAARFLVSAVDVSANWTKLPDTAEPAVRDAVRSFMSCLPAAADLVQGETFIYTLPKFESNIILFSFASTHVDTVAAEARRLELLDAPARTCLQRLARDVAQASLESLFPELTGEATVASVPGMDRYFNESLGTEMLSVSQVAGRETAPLFTTGADLAPIVSGSAVATYVPLTLLVEDEIDELDSSGVEGDYWGPARAALARAGVVVPPAAATDTTEEPWPAAMEAASSVALEADRQAALRGSERTDPVDITAAAEKLGVELKEHAKSPSSGETETSRQCWDIVKVDGESVDTEASVSLWREMDTAASPSSLACGWP